MLTIWGNPQTTCDRRSRRDFLKVGALGLTGLSLPDLYRLRAGAAQSDEAKAIIMIALPGGPSQFETYDLKPDAPKDIAGELKPISTNVPGMQISELFPLQAQIADRFAVVRGVNFYYDDAHALNLIFTGYGRPENVGTPIPGRMPRPAFGCIYSRLKGNSTADGMPTYVSLLKSAGDSGGAEKPAYAGVAHRPFAFEGQVLQDLLLPKGMTRDQVQERRQLLTAFDSMRRDVDAGSELAAGDAFTARALDLITSPKVRDAFDIKQEPQHIRELYGSIPNKGESGSIDPEKFLQARRLVEAGVPIVTLSVGGWDTHSKNFDYMRRWLPVLDRGLHGLITDLKQSGLDQKVCVVMWGEMGRTPKLNVGGGRDHWADSGFAYFTGGAGLRLGQMIGQTDARGERAKGKRYTVQNVLATVYHLLGIDPATTIPDHSGRPQYLLEEREMVEELL